MRTTADRGEIRESILDAATRLMDRFGYRKTTMDDLAREADIGKGTIYLYFRGKEEVALSVGDRINARLVECLRGIAAADAGAAERLGQILRHRILYRFDLLSGSHQSANEMYRDLWPAIGPRRDQYDAAEAAVIEDVIRHGVAAGELRCRDPRAAAYALVWGTNSQLPYSLTAEQMKSRDKVRERVDAIAGVLIAGLRYGPCSEDRP